MVSVLFTSPQHDNELLKALSEENANLRQENRELRAQLNRGSLEEDGCS